MKINMLIKCKHYIISVLNYLYYLYIEFLINLHQNLVYLYIFYFIFTLLIRTEIFIFANVTIMTIKDTPEEFQFYPGVHRIVPLTFENIQQPVPPLEFSPGGLNYTARSALMEDGSELFFIQELPTNRFYMYNYNSELVELDSATVRVLAYMQPGPRNNDFIVNFIVTKKGLIVHLIDTKVKYDIYIFHEGTIKLAFFDFKTIEFKLKKPVTH
jgi:hypothetical protein